MKTRVFTALVIATFFFAAPSFAYETYESHELEAFGDMRVLRVDAAMYLTLPINTPSTAMSDFRFLCEYSYEQLSRYNFGGNYDGTLVPQTSPMFIRMDVLEMSAPRVVQFIIPKEYREKPPAPRYPLHLDERPEQYFFVRPTNETEFWKILHAAADLLTDLSYSRMPFESTIVYLALYDYPPKVDETPVKATEIWVERSLKAEGYFVV